MKRFYFSVFVHALVLIAVVAIGFGANYIFIYQNSLDSKLKASLIDMESREIAIAKTYELEREQNISMVFVGDIMLSRGVENQIQENQDYNYPFQKVGDALKSYDIVFGNLENPVSDQGANQGSIYSFRADPALMKNLKLAGFNLVNLANNHIFDWGAPALVQTMALLDQEGIGWIGAGKNEAEANSPVIFKVGKSDNGIRVAFLGYTNLLPKSFQAKGVKPGISNPDISSIRNVIKQIKDANMADIIVVSFHWGEEYQTHSDSAQQKMAHDLIDAGADLIIGHHPHVIQEIERYNGKWITYSLGNFIFDQSFSEATKQGLVLKVSVENKKITDVEPLLANINNTFQPEITPDNNW